jgi:hypothetical protein
MSETHQTPLTVRVIARGGKFLGDDIGGALITVRDAQTGEILASGRTHGTSGPATVMTQPLLRTMPIPTIDSTVNPPAEACHFDVELDLKAPRLLEISAYGPLGAMQGAHTVTTTHWIYPGKSQTVGDGLVLEIPGLLVQILSPPTHWMPTTLSPPLIEIQANVTMMCGCPITPANVWPPQDFEVTATIRENDAVVAEFPLTFDVSVPYPSQFIGSWTAPAPGIYELTIAAYQTTSGNTGLNVATFIVPAA